MNNAKVNVSKYLTFVALEDNTEISFKDYLIDPQDGGFVGLNYSINGNKFTAYKTNQVIKLHTGEKLSIKAIFYQSSLLTPSQTVFSSSPMNVVGDLSSITNNLSGLLAFTPVIDASLLNVNAYAPYLFYGCTSLVNAPKLPANTLKDFCYDSMFKGCTSLVNAPELPATNLAGSCYNGMFENCRSLVHAPELPAVQLAENCYNSMFYGCTSLVNAPELPATNLAGSCYNGMFGGCANLNYIKMLATDISADYCLEGWVYGVSSTGTFVKSKDATWDVRGASGIPIGWTVETE